MLCGEQIQYRPAEKAIRARHAEQADGCGIDESRAEVSTNQNRVGKRLYEVAKRIAVFVVDGSSNGSLSPWNSFRPPSQLPLDDAERMSQRRHHADSIDRTRDNSVIDARDSSRPFSRASKCVGPFAAFWGYSSCPAAGQQMVPETDRPAVVSVPRWRTERPLLILNALASAGFWFLLFRALISQPLVLAYVAVALLMNLALVASIRGSAVRLGPDQFPELYNRVLELVRLFGMRHVPEVYLKQQDGALNAFATRLARAHRRPPAVEARSRRTTR